MLRISDVAKLSYRENGKEDVATVSLRYKNGMFATATSSWFYPERMMRVVVVGEKCSAIFDDYAIKDKLKRTRIIPKFLNRS